MDKTLLERFIEKYNLSGAADAVFLTSDKGRLTTRFITEDQSAAGIISTDMIALDDGQYGIYETSRLRSLIGVLDNDITITVRKERNKAVALDLSDANTQTVFVLADPSIIPSAPSSAKNVPYELIIDIDAKFMVTFIRGKNALSDSEHFTVVSDGTKAQVVLGYSKRNTNRIMFDVTTKKNAVIKPLHFSAQYMKDMLQANKECNGGVLEVSSQGISHVKFDVDGFDVNYYMPQADMGDDES